MFDVYLFGMVLRTNAFRLKQFPKPDEYQEIDEYYTLTGGETGTCATVLASLGCKVKMDGNFAGKNTYPLFKSFYGKCGVDISSMYFDENYDGLEDHVLISEDTRSPLGMFEKFYGEGEKRWNMPKAADVSEARVAGIDPYFGDESEAAASLCQEYNIPYVTIDCSSTSSLNRHAAINIISKEYFKFSNQEHLDEEALFKEYTENTDGLVIFTHGSRPIWYGRKGKPRKEFPVFKIEPISTLGAGDTFKAGAVYGLLQEMDDDALIKFAAACAATACTKFPLPLNPPKLDEVMRLVQKTEG